MVPRDGPISFLFVLLLFGFVIKIHVVGSISCLLISPHVFSPLFLQEDRVSLDLLSLFNQGGKISCLIG